MGYPENYVPTPPGPYPGQRTPSPEIGQANRQPSPPAPATAQANRTAVLNPPAPVTVQANTVEPIPTTTESAQPIFNGDPYNAKNPETGQVLHEPFATPLGVSPHFKTPDQNWTWDYGAGY